MSSIEFYNGHAAAAARSHFLYSLISPFTALVEAWGVALRRNRMRVELEGLSDRALADIGLNRGEIDAVVERSFRR